MKSSLASRDVSWLNTKRRKLTEFLLVVVLAAANAPNLWAQQFLDGDSILPVIHKEFGFDSDSIELRESSAIAVGREVSDLLLRHTTEEEVQFLFSNFGKNDVNLDVALAIVFSPFLFDWSSTQTKGYGDRATLINMWFCKHLSLKMASDINAARRFFLIHSWSQELPFREGATDPCCMSLERFVFEDVDYIKRHLQKLEQSAETVESQLNYWFVAKCILVMFYATGRDDMIISLDGKLDPAKPEQLAKAFESWHEWLEENLDDFYVNYRENRWRNNSIFRRASFLVEYIQRRPPDGLFDQEKWIPSGKRYGFPHDSRIRISSDEAARLIKNCSQEIFSRFPE